MLVPNVDTNISLSNWEDLFWSAFNEFVPKKKIRDKLRPPWIDKEVKTFCRKKDKASSKALRSKKTCDIEILKALTRDSKTLICSKYNRYVSYLSPEISQTWDTESIRFLN